MIFREKDEIPVTTTFWGAVGAKKGELLLGGERGKGAYCHYILHFEVQLELTASKRPKTKNRYMHTISIFSYNDLII